MAIESGNAAVQEALRHSYLTRGLTNEELQILLGSGFVKSRTFGKGDLIFQETDRPKEIMILVSGALLIAKDTLSGKRIIISRVVTPGDTFGEVYVFKRLDQYDMHAETIERTEVIYVDGTLLDGHEPESMRGIADKLIRNQLVMFANKAYQMNRRLRILSSASIREKIARLLLQRQGTDNKVQVMSREDMADYLNVTRPSLSREISAMVKEGIIASEGRTLIILDQEKLEEYI